MGPHSSPRVLCFGEALVDRLLPVGEDLTAVVAGACEDRLGGAPANVACGLARLGTPAALLGCLGTDSIGQAFAALFAERGVESGGIQWTSRRPSRVVLVRRDGSGESGFGGFLGDRGLGFADQDLDAEALYRAVLPWLAQADWLLCGTLALASPGSAAALDRLLALLPAPAAPPGKAAAGRPSLAVDVNWRPTFWGLPADSVPPGWVKERILPLLARASLLKCTAAEARWLFGEEDPQAIRAALPGRPAVCVTDGAHPMRWCLGGRCGTLVPFRIEAVDSTGAGDAFMAGLLHGLCQPGAMPDAEADPGALIRFAAACGSLVCRGAGAIDPQPSFEEVQRWLAAQGPGPGRMVPDHP